MLQRSRDLIAAESFLHPYRISSTTLKLQRSRDLIAAERRAPARAAQREGAPLQRSRDLIAAESTAEPSTPGWTRSFNGAAT